MSGPGSNGPNSAGAVGVGGHSGSTASPTYYKFKVGFHSWAWSIRTSGFPVWALGSDGRLQLIGTTEKRPTIYRSPSPIVVRGYRTNSGYRRFYIYNVSNWEPELITVLDETDNWFLDEKTLEKVPEGYREAVLKLHRTLVTEDSIRPLVSEEESEGWE